MHFFYLWMWKHVTVLHWFLRCKIVVFEGFLGVHICRRSHLYFCTLTPEKKNWNYDSHFCSSMNSTLSCNYLIFLWRSMLQTWTVIPCQHLSHSSLNELLLLMLQKSCTSWYGTNSKKKIQVLYIPGGERQISEPSTVSLPCLNLKSGRFPISKSSQWIPTCPSCSTSPRSVARPAPKNANPAVWKLICLEGTRTKLSTIHLQINERRHSHNGDDISKKGYGPLIRFRILKVQWEWSQLMTILYQTEFLEIRRLPLLSYLSGEIRPLWLSLSKEV